LHKFVDGALKLKPGEDAATTVVFLAGALKKKLVEFFN
jgi:hypothetical protein